MQVFVLCLDDKKGLTLTCCSVQQQLLGVIVNEIFLDLCLRHGFFVDSQLRTYEIGFLNLVLFCMLAHMVLR